MMKPIYCFQCHSLCKPPQGLSNTVVCPQCGYIFEVMRGRLQEETDSESLTKKNKQMAAPALPAAPAVPALPAAPALPGEVKPKRNSTPPRGSRQENSNDGEEPLHTPGNYKGQPDDDETKGRFALQRPEDMLYDTYAAPFKDVEQAIENATGKSKPAKTGPGTVAIETPKQFLARVAERLNEANKVAGSDTKTGLKGHKPTPAAASADTIPPKVDKKDTPVPTRRARRNLAHRIRATFVRSTRSWYPAAYDATPAKPTSQVKPYQKGRFLVTLLCLCLFYIMSMAPVFCFFPNPPGWVLQVYYPVIVLQGHIPWLKAYQQWCDSILGK